MGASPHLNVKPQRVFRASGRWHNLRTTVITAKRLLRDVTTALFFYRLSGSSWRIPALITWPLWPGRYHSLNWSWLRATTSPRRAAARCSRAGGESYPAVTRWSPLCPWDHHRMRREFWLSTPEEPLGWPFMTTVTSTCTGGWGSVCVRDIVLLWMRVRVCSCGLNKSRVITTRV